MKCLTCGKEQEKKFCKACTDKARQRDKILKARLEKQERIDLCDCDPYDYGLTMKDMYR